MQDRGAERTSHSTTRPPSAISASASRISAASGPSLTAAATGEIEGERSEPDPESQESMAEVEADRRSDRSRSAPSHSGQLGQASAVPLLVVTAALTMALSAISQSATLSAPTPPAGRTGAGPVRAKIRHSALSRRSAVPRCRATDHGLF